MQRGHNLLVRQIRMAVLGLSALLGGVLGVCNIGLSFERNLREVSADMRQQPASGNLHIVEIDARSIAAIDRWPWPRSNYARLVDQLREAGAASIAFDVDFSSHSNPHDDAAFAAALARADGKVVLPTFGQHAGGGQTGWTDSLPIPILREHATLAAVTIRPEGDGFIRKAPLGTVTNGVPRPSLSAILANVHGTVDRDFFIDYAIDPTTIPRHSFVDVRDGRFDRGQLAGKQVLIGATAVEMGDRYAVPNHKVIPGVVIQALAAETLTRGTPREAGWILPMLAALACAWLIIRQRLPLALLAAVFLSPAALFAFSTIAHAQLNWILEITPGLATLACTSAAAVGLHLLQAAYWRRAHDAHTGLPNRLALRGTPSIDSRGIFAARLAEFDKLSATLGEQPTADLIRRVQERIALIACGNSIYRVEDRILAWRCSDFSELEDRLAALHSIMLSPVEVAGRKIDVTLAVGFARREPGESEDGSLAHALMAADYALSNAQPWHIYDPSEQKDADLEVSLLGELDEAVRKGEIDVVYQPKLCLKTDAIVSVEALVRWHHPTRGYLRPDAFIPLAERNGRIARLTLYVVKRTMRDLASWRTVGHDINAAVNISAKLLNSPAFLAALREVIMSSAMPPSKLSFEITESAAMTNTEEAAAALRSFKELGIAISMDDYGTGQSSLSYLKNLPLDELKIDRSFVQFAHQNQSDGLLVRSTIKLAHELGLKVVAEGVEELECLNFIRSAGCDLAQGYLISKPIPAGELQALLGQARADAA